MTINLSPPQARREWLNEYQVQVRNFAGNTIPNFDAKWVAFKHSTQYNTDTGEYFLLAAASSVRCNILIFNTRHDFAHDALQ